MRHLSFTDQLIRELDHGLRTVFCRAPSRQRLNPANSLPKAQLDAQESRISQGLMRVDHTGEICAQALYRGQACTVRDAKTRQHLHQAAEEEQDHLAWCQDRLHQLQTYTSHLNVFWYTASFLIGATTSLIGNQWSLGFVIATEEKVERHIDDHLARLPATDHASRAILLQMKQDEADHANAARHAGGKILPSWIQSLMSWQSKVMTTTAYYI